MVEKSFIGIERVAGIKSAIFYDKARTRSGDLLIAIPMKEIKKVFRDLGKMK